MHLRILFAVLFGLNLSTFATADKLVDFHRDVQPVLVLRCLECHGPEKAKNDFRVDDAESMSYYVEPGDLEGSSLWADYLVTEDPDMKMPPLNSKHHDGMTAAELATIKLWIEEGAKFDWKEAAVEGSEGEPEESELASPVDSLTMPDKVWIFQGLFHPAMTHFPIALLSISVVFLVLSKFAGKSFESAAFHCLWVGAIGATVACITGWSYASHEGYSVAFSAESAVDRHRWLGIIVAVGALILVPIAYAAVKGDSGKTKLTWFLGACLLGLCVSIVGFQGGEMTYGEGHYEKEFQYLFLNEEAPGPSPVAEQTESHEAAATSDESETTE